MRGRSGSPSRNIAGLPRPWGGLGDAGCVVPDGGTEPDGEAVPTVDGHDREREGDELLLGEDRCHFGVGSVRSAGFGQKRQLFASGKGCPLSLGENRHLAPSGDEV